MALRAMLGGCGCGPTFGVPPIAEQAPASYPASAPISARTDLLIGTVPTSQPPRTPIRVVGTNLSTLRPVYEAPASAGLTGGQISTISKQSGANPGPVPVVGTISPQAGSCVPSTCAAPGTGGFGTLALVIGVILLLWLAAGVSVGRLLR